MKTVEKVYIGGAILSSIGLLFTIFGIPPFVSHGHSGPAVYFYIFGLFSFLLGAWGIVLISKARDRKASFWTLIVATILASLYGIWFVQFIFILGRRMEISLLLLLVGVYAITASWVARHGPGRLWLMASGTLLLMLVGGWFLFDDYYISMAYELFNLVALTGPIVVFPTTMLSLATMRRATIAKALPTAILGACIGFVCGLVIYYLDLELWGSRYEEEALNRFLGINLRG
jgi:hypothetical protein